MAFRLKSGYSHSDYLRVGDSCSLLLGLLLNFYLLRRKEITSGISFARKFNLGAYLELLTF